MTTTQTATIIDRSAATELARDNWFRAVRVAADATDKAEAFLFFRGHASVELTWALEVASKASEAAYWVYRDAMAVEFAS